MKLTAEQIVNAVEAIVSIGKRNAPIPAMASYKFGKMHDRLMLPFREIEKKKFELIQTYGQEIFTDPPANTKSTGQWSIPENSEHMETYKKEIGGLMKEEFDIPLLTPISLHLIGNQVNGLTVAEVVNLGVLITDPSETQEVA